MLYFNQPVFNYLLKERMIDMYTSEVRQVPCALYDKHLTIYRDPEVTPRTALIYFHGGGLLYGSREDLPKLHLDMLPGAGCVIAAFDYPLAPAAKMDVIVKDAADSVNYWIANAASILGKQLPYFLWGRSAGAWLALITAAKSSLSAPPSGVVSFYGYGFLTDNWYCYPSSYYQALPPADESIIDALPKEITGEAPLGERYMVYLYARQTGKWKDMIYEGRDKYFYTDYTLRLTDRFPCPLFASHSTGDTDVPYAEFTELCAKYEPTRFIATSASHDYDRNEDDPETANTLRKMTAFLDKCLLKAAASQDSADAAPVFSDEEETVKLTCSGCKNACGITAKVKDGRLTFVTGGCHYSIKSARRQLRARLRQDRESLEAPVEFRPL